jgi:hypothetical protein
MMGLKRRVAVAFGVAAALDAVVACYDWDLAADGGALDGSIGGALVDGTIGDGGLDANDLDVFVPDGGCTPSIKCAQGFVCTYADHKCGSGDHVGTCVLPDVCVGSGAAPSSPTCGCDSKLYNDPCMAGQQGQDLNVNGSCAGDVDAAFFQCGYLYCERTLQFCVSDADGGFACDKYICADASVPNDCTCAKAEVCPAGSCPGLTSSPTLTLYCP